MKNYKFGIADDKGRAIGALIGLRSIPIRPSGRVYEARVQASRGGQPFGSRQPWRRFATEREAKNWMLDRLDAMARRYHREAILRAEGCYARWVDRETGHELTLRDAEDYETDPSAGRYFVICEAHSTCVGVETKAAGLSSSGFDFCDECRAGASVRAKALT